MTKFEAIKAITDEKKFADLMFDMVRVTETSEKFTQLLSEELSEEGPVTVQMLVQRGYPLSFERKPKEQKNSDWFISERIINISELEEYIELSNVSVQLLKKEMKKNNPSTELVNELLDTISTNISKAKNFEFCIERRKTISKNLKTARQQVQSVNHII